MTEEEVVVNVRGEISEGGAENGDDQHKIKGEYCNVVVAHTVEKEKEKAKEEVVIANCGGEVDGDSSGENEAVADGDDSGVSDLVVVVDDNGGGGGPASEDLQLQFDLERKVDDDEALDESHVTVLEAAEAERECEMQQLNNTERDRMDASAVSGDLVEEICETEIDNSTVSVDADVDVDVGGGENVVSAEESQNKAEIDSVVDNIESVPDVDESQECGNIIAAADADVSGDEKDVMNVVEGVTDVNKSADREFKSVDVENGLADTELSECTVENEIPVVVDGVSATVVEECADEVAPYSSEEKAQVESVSVTYHGCNGDVKESEPVSATVVEECADEVAPNSSEEKAQAESVSVTDHDCNGDVKESEPVSATDVEECADEVAQNSSEAEVESVSVTDHNCNGDEKEKDVGAVVLGISESVSATDVEEFSEMKAQIESVTITDHDLNGDEKEKDVGTVDTDVDRSIVGADVQNGLAETELGECTEENGIPIEGEPDSKLERFEEDSGHELVPEGEDLSALNSKDMPEDGNVVSDMNDNGVQSEGEPSVDMSGMNDNGVESEGEPSSVDTSGMNDNAMESEGEPSADIKNKAVEIEGEGEGGNRGDEDSRPTQEGSTTDILDGQNMATEVVKRPFYYLIRLPRYEDHENIKEQIKNALHHVEEKTKSRDAIRAESQIKKASCKECAQDVRAAISDERAARDLLKSKRQEMDSVQSTMSRLNNAISVEDIDSRIRNMEHMIEHETLPLKEEKQLLRQIKQLKQNREELSSHIGKQDQSQQSLDHKDSIEEHFKHLQLLKKEVESLRNNVLKTEAATKAAKKKYDDEYNKLSELLARFKAADDIRQEAYAKLHALKKQLHEKSQYFWDYRNAANKGKELAAEGKREELQCFCVNQVERIMELWNKNDEFRRDYVRCNTRSTLRRLTTLDGRSLGPDEEPPVIPNALTERTNKNNSSFSQSTLEQEKKSLSPETVNIKDEPVSNVVVQTTERSQTTKAKKPVTPAPLEKSLGVVSRWGDEAEDAREEPVRTKEEEEMILKAEKVRKEEEEAKLKEKRRLEEIEKAKEAMQRKKRNAEKAQQRAALKAQKEAEQKEKEREKKARKKERRKAASTDTADITEQESAPSSETLTRSTEECDQSEKPVEVTRRPQKPTQFTRQTKAKSLPLPLRNRGKRRIQSWMWWVLITILVAALFYIGNYSSLRSVLRGFGF